MAGQGSVNYTISARDASSGTIKRINKSLDGLKKTAASMSNDVKRAGKSIAVVAGAVSYFTVTAIKEAAADQASQAQLIAALKARGVATDNLTSSIDNAIAAGQQLGFTDDQVRSSLEAATRFTKDFSKAQRISEIAQQVSRITGQDLATATLNVGKAYRGTGARLLMSLGITKKGIKGQEALAAIFSKTKGATEAYSKTTAGAFSVVQIKAKELQEQFGAAFLPAVGDFFRALAPELDKFSRWLATKTPDIQRFANDFTQKIIAKIPGFFALIREKAPAALKKIGEFVDRITSIGDSAKGLLGPNGDITLLISGIGAAFGGLSGVIAANLTAGGMDPLQAYFTAIVAKGVMEGVIAGLLKEAVVQAIASFGLKMAAASAAGSAGAALGGANGVVGIAATTLGVSIGAVAAGLGIFAAALGLQSALNTSAEDKANYRFTGMPNRMQFPDISLDVTIGQESVDTAVRRSWGSGVPRNQ